MIDNLFKEKINIVRKKLIEDENSILFAQINESLRDDCTDFEIINEHREILKLFNGGRFGSVDLFDYDLVKEHNKEDHWKQISDSYRRSNNLNLYIIGQILYKPIFVDRDTKEIYVTMYEEDGMIEKLVNTKFDLINFVKNFIFSVNHLKIIDGDTNDEWYQFVLKL